MESKTSLLSRLMDATKKYRLQNQTRYQRVLSIAALCFSLHYAVGLLFWSMFIYSQTVVLIRIAKPSLFWWALWGWLPFCARCWKSATPFMVALLAIYLVVERPKVASRLICCLLVFTLICASYDIACGDFDLRVHHVSRGTHVGYYFTWWWYRQRLS